MKHKSWFWQPSCESARSGIVENTVGKEPKHLANSTYSWQVIYTYIKYMAIALSTLHIGRNLKYLASNQTTWQNISWQSPIFSLFILQWIKWVIIKFCTKNKSIRLEKRSCSAKLWTIEFTCQAGNSNICQSLQHGETQIKGRRQERSKATRNIWSSREKGSKKLNDL